MRGAEQQSRFIAAVAKPVAEPSCGERLAMLRHQERKIAEGAYIERVLQFSQNGEFQRYWLAPTVLLLRKTELTVLHVLPAEQDYI